MPEQTTVGAVLRIENERDVIRDEQLLGGTDPSAQRMLGDVGVHGPYIGQRMVFGRVHLGS